MMKQFRVFGPVIFVFLPIILYLPSSYGITYFVIVIVLAVATMFIGLLNNRECCVFVVLKVCIIASSVSLIVNVIDLVAMLSLRLFGMWQDNVPLASLPLLGYSISKPTELDGIRREYVFKLQFKNHVYFFRADSAYTYDR